MKQPNAKTVKTSNRDDAFWKRFSIAVHLDEEKAQSVSRSATDRTGSTTSRKQPTTMDTWLDRHQRKSRKACVCGWIIVLFIIFVIAAVVVVCLWLNKTGPFAPPHHSVVSATATATATAVANNT